MIGSLRALVWKVAAPDPATAGDHIPAVRDLGWPRSRRENRSVDVHGQPIPWITYPALEFLTRRVRPDMKVFEYGCGASTLWWSSRVARVVAVEHDAEWARATAAKVPANAEIVHAPLDPQGTYALNALAHETLFDVVVIDGRDRSRCARTAVEAVTPEGVIVFDNTERARYASGYRALSEAGFRRIEFFGLSPIAEVASETSIYYRPGNCLGI